MLYRRSCRNWFVTGKHNANCSNRDLEITNEVRQRQISHDITYTEGRKMVLRVRSVARATWKLASPFVKPRANENLLYVSGNSNRGYVST